MDKEQVAAALEEIGTLLELRGENAFRCNAYRNAGRTIGQLETDLAELVAADRLGEVRGIGDTLKEKITTLVQTGRLPFLDELRAETPPGLLQMLRVPGLGPKKVMALRKELEIDDLAKLRAACESDRVAHLKGFGAKTQEKILEGLAFLDQLGERVRLDQAEAVAVALLEGLRDVPGLKQLEPCGSLRRRKEVIGDIDILASASNPAAVMERFVSLPGVAQVTGQGETKASIRVAVPDSGGRQLINADLRVVDESEFPFAINYFTGSKEHNIALRARAQARGLKLNEYGLTPVDGKKRAPKCRDEADVYKALGLAYIPPELREQTGEIEAAEADELPTLLEPSDIRGVFHCHTTASDGADSLEAMANAARRLGFAYFGLGDHSQSLTVANGLSPARLREQHQAIDTLNQKWSDFRLFKGTECDILPDGTLDYDDDLLAECDYVVASVHTHFNQPKEQMTQRILRAMRHPLVTMLGHATGRLLLRRDSYAIDVEAILQTAVETGTLIEINAHPCRLDIDWVQCKRARLLGVQLVINPDAHSAGEIGLFRYGVDVARRGWLTKADVFNTRTTAEVARFFASRRKRAGRGA